MSCRSLYPVVSAILSSVFISGGQRHFVFSVFISGGQRHFVFSVFISGGQRHFVFSVSISDGQRRFVFARLNMNPLQVAMLKHLSVMSKLKLKIFKV